MGFQKGHIPYNDWSKVNEMLKTNQETRNKWLESKRKQIPWNKGLKKSDYPNGIASGPSHGNWCGNPGGKADLAKMKEVKNIVRARDNWTCQHCGDRNHKGRGSRIILDVHHIVSLAEDSSLAYDLDNLITLCRSCHIKTDNYGTKVVHKLRKRGGS